MNDDSPKNGETGDAADNHQQPYEYPHEDDQYTNPSAHVEQTARENTADENKAPQEKQEKKSKDAGEKSGSKTDKTPKPDNKDKRMPFLDHLEELRWTIMRSLVAVVISSIVCYIFSKQIVDFLRYPAPEDLQLIYLSPTEGFMIYIKVSICAGLVVAFPYIAYQLWQFIVPGLLERERKYVPHIAFFTTVCFLTGAAFAYYLIVPFGLKFLLAFQTDYLSATIAIGKYLGFVVTLILVFGAVFELPVLAFFLSYIGLLTPEFLTKYRRYGIVIIFIIAAVLTPPDVFTQLMLAGPLLILYEISILITKLVRKKKQAAELEG
ncbi:MAG TPA: twin-arginine translocase subunit TatC [bacterium]|nr:twin-arginine translocase subunit TatC [bacterium]HPN42355.1 twin-arginine translocase subunit TatC [bacterium]